MSRPVRISIVIAVVIIFFGAAAKLALRNEFVIVNQSGRDLVDVTFLVTGGGSTHTFPSVPAGSERRGHFKVGSDGEFRFTATLSGGLRIAANGGYVTARASGERVRITVGPDSGVRIEQ